jgi:GT2 family glycosyltransferase
VTAIGQQAPDISILIVNWNSAAYLRECLASIAEQTHGLRLEVVVVDNASTEQGLDRVEPEFPEVHFLRLEKNLGFAGANNEGFRHSHGRYVLLLNPDTKLITPAINIMLEKMEGLPDAGIVGCTLLNSDLTVSTTSIQRFPTILNQLLTFEYLRVRFPTCPLWSIDPLFRESRDPVRVDVIPGACMLLRRETFERAGLLNEHYFMYAEDIDLNYKVNKLGLASYYIGHARIVHHGGGSSSQQTVSRWSIMMMQRAMGRYFRTNRGRAYGIAYQITTGISAVIRLIALGFLCCLGQRSRVQNSMGKWLTILKWSLFGESHSKRVASA